METMLRFELRNNGFAIHCLKPLDYIVMAERVRFELTQAYAPNVLAGHPLNHLSTFPYW